MEWEEYILAFVIVVGGFIGLLVGFIIAHPEILEGIV